MMMQSNSKEIEVKNNGIDLTETGTIGKPVKLDYPFHPDSQAYWLWEVPEDEKLRILLEKCNQFETYYKFFSLEHIVETIFKSSEYRFKKKKEDIENHLELLPNRKEQIIDDEKLKVYNEIKEWKLVSSGNEPHDDCFLDLERSKEIFIEHTFLSLGFKSVKEIENYILSLIAYRGNLLYINYLKQLSTPAPKEIEQGKDKKVKIKTPTFVVMLEVAETINKEEKFLPKDWINRTDKLSKYKKAIFDRFGFDYSESTIKNKISENLTNTHRLKVIKMLNEYGRMDLAKQYQIQYKCTT